MNTRYLALAALVAGVTACGGSQTVADNSEGAATDVAEEAVEEAEVVVETMMLRVINAANGDAAIMIGETASDVSATGTFNQTRVEAAAGDVEIAGTVGAMNIADTLNFEADGNYTVVIMGDTVTASNNPHAVAFVDDMTAPAEGHSAVRFVHAGYGMDNVAVTVDGTGVTSDIGYGDASEYHAGPATTADLVVSVAGAPVATKSIPFVEGRLFTVVGYPSEDGWDFVVVNEAPAAAPVVEAAPATEAAPAAE